MGLKNLLGVGCLFFGVLLLVLPGQGVLTIVVGLALLDFPGKYRLQRRIVSQRTVLRTANRIWRRAPAGIRSCSAMTADSLRGRVPEGLDLVQIREVIRPNM